ncbi:MAG TPA: class I SAM-dependent methyltransferase [Candidatus Paceibacterota bacterium]|nr:class I SAM-dependent methyltransferase [Verrucomicrobiota bacterium]HRY50103.1 class I SAM-dependent methyltransferase [Candidatus Paceibacterota bacterium]
MKNRWIFAVVLTFLGFFGLQRGLAAEKPKMSEIDREKYIREFRRTGLNTTPGDAMMLRILVESAKCKRGVEVGSATGYGAMNMGIAFERNGGQLITVDIDPEMVRKTRENLAKMGLEKTVSVVEGDALQVLPKLEGEFDFVFLDALKRDYLKYFQMLSPKLKKGAVIVADNVIQSAGEMRDFLAFFENNPDYDSVTIRASMEKNDGMLIAYKLK